MEIIREYLQELYDRGDHKAKELLDWYDHREKIKKRIKKQRRANKKQVWVFQYRRAYDDDYVEIFDKKPSRKFLDKMLMEELLPDEFSESNTTPRFERNESSDPCYYEELYSCKINVVAAKNQEVAK